MNLVEITAATHDVEIALAYACDDNFTGKPVYGRAACYLHPDADVALRRVSALAGVHGLRLKIFDAFRPAEAQWTLWEHTPDPKFLADPRRGSPHSRGVAVDLTLLDRTGRELEMGTGFDEFSSKAHHGDTAVSATAQKNRALLLGIMTAAGWDYYRYEWWHYQLFDSRRYPLLGDSVLPESLL